MIQESISSSIKSVAEYLHDDEERHYSECEEEEKENHIYKEVQNLLTWLDNKPKSKFMIYGSVDNGSPNLDVFYVTENKEEAKEVYKKLQELQQEMNGNLEIFNRIYDVLKSKGINIWGEDEWIENFPRDFNVSSLVEIQEVEK